MKDKLVFTPQQEPLARFVVQTVVKKNKYPLVISIGGLSGSGKSEVAVKVRNELWYKKKYSKIISQDAYYQPTHEKMRKSTGYKSVGKNEIQWTSVNNAVGNLVNSHVYDVVIFEGLYACCTKVNSDIRFFIDQDYHDSYYFRKLRGKENPDCEDRQLVLSREEIEIGKTKENVNYMLRYEEGK